MQVPEVKKCRLLVIQIVIEAISLGGFAYVLLYVSPLAVAGVVTTVTSLTFKVWGQPAQLLRLYRLKSSEGISWITHGIATMSYMSWCLYGLRSDDWVIVISQSLGMVGSIVTLHLVLRYRLGKPAIKYGVLFWLWDNASGKWRGATYTEYITVRGIYQSLPAPGMAYPPSTNQAKVYNTDVSGIPSIFSPWYWSMWYEGVLLQGCVTDANVLEPSLKEMAEGMVRLAEQLTHAKIDWEFGDA